MAKRKKSKKHPPNEATAGSQSPTPVADSGQGPAEPPIEPVAVLADAEPADVPKTPPCEPDKPALQGEPPRLPSRSSEPRRMPPPSPGRRPKQRRTPPPSPGPGRKEHRKPRSARSRWPRRRELEPVADASRLESIVESLLFASDKPLGLVGAQAACSASAMARRSPPPGGAHRAAQGRPASR